MGLKRQLHHGVTGEGKVKVVELFSASGPNGESEAEVITGFAGPYFEGGRVEIGVEFLAISTMASAKPSTRAPITLMGKSQGYSISDSLRGSSENGVVEVALISWMEWFLF